MGNKENVPANNAFTLYNQDFRRSYYAITGSNNVIYPGFYPLNNGNSSTGWEKNIMTDIGLDVSLFNNKLEVTVDYYKKYVKGLLFPQPVPATTGEATPPFINLGDIENKGVDLAVRYRGTFAKEFTYNLAA